MKLESVYAVGNFIFEKCFILWIRGWIHLISQIGVGVGVTLYLLELLLLKGRSHWCQSFFGAKSEALACATDSVVRSKRTPK